MEMRKRNFLLGSNSEKAVDFPLRCSYCGLPSVLKEVSSASTSMYKDTTGIVQVLYAHCCAKYVFAFYIQESDKYTFQCMYPPASDIRIESSIEEISPRFVNLYRGANLAEDNGFIELAGSGYRNALEVLVKDFAIKLLNEPEEAVSKKSLFNAIESYLPDSRLQKAADVVRILGNDHTHYQRQYEDLGLDVLKSYLNIFIARIHAEYLMAHPPVSRDQTSSPTS